MARLLARLRTETQIDHRSFDLLDDGGPQEVAPVFGDSARWLFTGRNSVTVVTHDSDQDNAVVTVEAWDGEPSPEPGFERVVQARLQLDSGLLEVNPLVEDDAEWLGLPGPGSYHLRAYAAGDHYLFQFWP
jgi:hypothetical protein